MRWNPFQFARSPKPVRRPIRRVLLALEELESRITPSNVVTYHNDNSSTGQNPNETTLTPSNVNTSTFGKQFSTSVDGQIYAQPLYVPGVNITTGSNQGTHNVVFVTTENDSLYAIDANNGTVLWHDSLLNPVHGGTVTPVPSSDVGSNDLSPQIGITGTPVIDTSTNTIYVEAKTKEVASDGSHYIHQLYAINVSNGSYVDGGPAVIADSIGDTYVSGPTVHGTGAGSSNGTVYFDSLRQMERPGLTEANGNIYLAFASHGDNGPYHGWVLSYNVANLQLNGVFNTTPNGSEGGIWQGGGKLITDSSGNLYFETGNGTFDTTLNSSGMPVNGDYGDSFVKIAVDPTTSPTNQNVNGWGLKAVDYFTPSDQQTLNNNDFDLGSGGPMLLPPEVGSTAHPQLLVGSGKEGRIYLIDAGNMGHFNASSDNIVQETSNGAISGSFDTPAYFNGAIYYFGGSNIGGPNDPGKAFSISNGQMSLTPIAQGPDTFAYPGATPSISSNGTSNGIVWALDHGTNQLRAYNATGFTELYTSAQAANSRDALTGSEIKFSVPTVANGQVFVGTSNALNVYGLLGSTSTNTIIDNGQPGYSETGTGWGSYTGGYNGSHDYHAAGTGAEAANWQFNNLAAGTYTVSADWSSGSNHASNATYQIYDGNGNLLATTTVNQQNASTGPVSGGVAFQNLATVTLANPGSLKVVLTDNANQYIYTDAVQVVSGTLPPAPLTIDNGQSGYSQSGSGWGSYTGGYNGSHAYHAAGTGAEAATWQFSNLAAGTYTVSADWSSGSNHASNATYQIYDGSGNLLATTTVNQQNASTGTSSGGVNFQNLATVTLTNAGSIKLVLSDNANQYIYVDAAQLTSSPPPAPVIIDNGQSGFSESGTGWGSYTGGYNGSHDYHAAGTGAEAATWQASNLAAGTYTVSADWSSGSNHASNAAYQIYDGNGNLLATTTVNQQNASTGTASGGVNFQNLATVTLTNAGSLKLVLSDNANQYIYVDAAMFTPTTSSPNTPQVATGGDSKPTTTTNAASATASAAGSNGASGASKTVAGASPALSLVRLNGGDAFAETNGGNESQAPGQVNVPGSVVPGNDRSGNSPTGPGWQSGATGYDGGARHRASISGDDKAS